MAGSAQITISGLPDLTGFGQSSTNVQTQLMELEKLIRSIRRGTIPCSSLVIATGAANAVRASGSVTFDAVVATDTLVVNGVTFTAMASGATGDQFNRVASMTTTAANAAAAINASTTAGIAGVVTASSSGADITITANIPGVWANVVALSQTGNHITVTDSVLADGAGCNGVPVTYTVG